MWLNFTMWHHRLLVLLFASLWTNVWASSELRFDWFRDMESFPRSLAIGSGAGIIYLLLLCVILVRRADQYRCRLVCSSVLVSTELAMDVFVICLTVYSPYVTSNLPMIAAAVELAGTALTDYLCAGILYL
jgi:hypothetical protein